MRQITPDREENDRPDRQVDEEHEVPADRVRDEAADGRPEQAREREHRPEQALVPTALVRREQVGDRRHGDRKERAGVRTEDRRHR